MSTPLRIGIVGAGIVGGGVIDLVQKLNSSGRFKSIHVNMEIIKVCVQSLNKERDVDISSNSIFTVDYRDVVDDSTLNCVVEVMGGTTIAKDVVLTAIKNGKHVITANKALIAAHMPEIQAALIANPSVRFCFEAAVCGGIPIIHSLHSDFLGDRVTRLMGIMNGTTNFMLCKMEDEGADYGDALREAQRLGYAEADPTADVEGLDVQAKIAVLAKLAFGKSLTADQVPTTGISKLSAVDFEYAALMHSTIKLVGTANLNSDGSLAVFVSPTVVSLKSPLSTVKGPGNMVVVNSDNLGSSTFTGPGAGRYATANSVLSDLIRLAQGVAPANPFQLEAPADLVVKSDYSSRFYVRIKCADALGIIRAVGEAAENHGVSIHSVLQNPVADRSRMDFVVTTEETSLSRIRAFATAIESHPRDFALEPLVFLPIL